MGAILQYGNVYGANNIVNYSTGEQKTGQKWVDGKDIYQKTIFKEGQVMLTSGEWTSVGITVEGIDKIIESFTTAYQNNAVFHFDAYCDSSDLLYLQTTRSGGLNVRDLYITLFYTKTE